jgi:pro-apoptotic serine protease NMA111
MRYLTRTAPWAVLLLFAMPLAAQEATWNRTLERIASGVVSIHVDSTRAFDTERNQSTQATGFVVDAQRGLILTNRHVVTPGPVKAQAIFLNQEEVDLYPVYRDPIHDFGFFRYDPSDLKFIEPTVLPLVPEAAQIGRDIRVIGNDAGERLSILAGTIARLDRQAPNYGRGNYNDFNTFYMQAASGTSGGSSGSPVIDIDGRVVALNAGANTQASSSFFLPLDRVSVALEMLRNGSEVPRGTLQTEFVHTPYAELRRLGLSVDTEERVREAFPRQTGMLVVEQVIPGSPASAAFEPGDVLVAVDGSLVSEFVPLAAVLDSKVGEKVTIVIDRGGEEFTHELFVDDLHAITPAEYIEYGDGVLHNLSYQQARHFNRPATGVYVANPGYVFGSAAIPRASLITEIASQPIQSLDDLQRVLEAIPLGAQVSVRFLTFDDPQSERQRIITNDRSWFPAVRCHRDDDAGIWPCVDLAEAPQRAAAAPRETTFPEHDEPHLQRIAPSLVLVNFSMPYTISGVSDRYYYGTGLIVDAERGWILVDRNTVPVAIGDVRITFAGSVEISGRVEYVHPLHNLAIVSYDPELIGATPVRSAEISAAPLVPGRTVSVVGLAPDHNVLSQTAQIAAVSEASFPLSRTLRFRDSNLEVVTLVSGPSDFDGVIVDAEGRVLAHWASFAYQSGRDMTQVNMGIPGELIDDMLSHMRNETAIRSLEVEWRMMPLATARKLALPDAWAQLYEVHSPRRREVLAVSSTVGGSPASSLLRSGDILLSIDGKPVNTFREVERASQRSEVEVTVYRDGRELMQVIPTVELDGKGVDRIVSWAGALLQEPHRAIAAQRGIAPTGVYVSYFNFGSPASRYGLFAGRRIIAIDGLPTPDLDRLADVIERVGGRESVRVNTVNWNDVPEVITLKPDPHHWPSYQLRRDGYEWRRQEIETDLEVDS